MKVCLQLKVNKCSFLSLELEDKSQLMQLFNSRQIKSLVCRINKIPGQTGAFCSKKNWNAIGP